MTQIERRSYIYFLIASFASLLLLTFVHLFDTTQIIKKSIFFIGIFCIVPLLAFVKSDRLTNVNNKYDSRVLIITAAVATLIFLVPLCIEQLSIEGSLVVLIKKLKFKQITIHDAYGIFFGVILAFILVYIMPHLKPRTRNHAKNIYLLLAVLGTLLFFDLHYYYDISHYMPYLGPANSVLEGGIPLKDVFSQYGQGYLLFDLFYLVFPRTPTVAALANFCLNTLQFILYIFMLRKLVNNNFIFIIAAVLTIAFWHYLPGYPHNNTPSHGAMRYLGIYLLATSLVYMPLNKSYSTFSLSVFAICIAWSFETFIWSCILYSCFVNFKMILKNQKFLYFSHIQASAKFAFIFVLLCVIELLSYRISFGCFPKIDLYLSLLKPYLSNDLLGNHLFFETSYFTFDPKIYYWLIHVVVYSSTLLFCLAYKLNGVSVRNNDSLILQFFLIATFGIIISQTCLLNTNKINLLVISFPLYILLFGLLDIMQTDTKLYSASRCVAFIPLALMLCVFITSIFRYDKPYESLAYSLLNKRTDIKIISPHINEFCDPTNNACRPLIASGGICVNDQSNSSCMAIQEFNEAEYLINKWQANQELFMFYQWNSILAMKHHKRLNFPTSWPLIELMSKPMFEFVTTQGNLKIRANDTIIVAKEYQNSLTNNFDIINLKILQNILQTWITSEIDQTEHFIVYKINGKK